MSACIACGGKRSRMGHGVWQERRPKPAQWVVERYGMLCEPCAQATADARNAAIKGGTAIEDTYTMMEAKR